MSKLKDKQVGGDHYKNLAIQPIEYAERNEMTFSEGSVVKYVTRHKFKDGKKDILKAIHFLEMILEIYYPENDEKTIQPKQEIKK